MQTALRSRIKNDAGVAAIAGTKVDWETRPQRTEYPAVVLDEMSDARPQHMAGFATFRPTTVQINCFATTKKQAVELREAVLLAVLDEVTVSGTTFLRAQNITCETRKENTETGVVYNGAITVALWHN